MFLVPGAIPAVRPARLALGQRERGREGRRGRVVGGDRQRQRQGPVALLEADELHLRAGRDLALHPAAGKID